MNRNDFRNPLIQSGVVLLVVFLLISIVTNSPSDGFVGSTIALITGLAKGVLFLIGLSIALVVSILILIGIFIAVTSLHSMDKAKSSFQQTKDSIGTLYEKVGRSRKKESQPGEHRVQSSPVAPTRQPADTKDPVPPKELVQNKDSASLQMTELVELTGNLSHNIASLQKQVVALEEKLDRFETEYQSPEKSESPTDEPVADTPTLELTINNFNDFQQSVTNELKELRTALSALDEKTSMPEVVSGILSYIDKPEDRETFSKKAEEVVARGMTYAQADAFFKKSLAPKVYKSLASHPRLTKDFIRSIKKKFS